VSAAVSNALRPPAFRPVHVVVTVAILLMMVPIGYYLFSNPSRGPVLQFAQVDNPVYLAEGLRGDAAKTTVTERDGGVELGIVFEPFFDAESYRLELRSDEKVILSVEVPERSVTPERGLTLRLGTASLPAGEYQLMLECSDKATGQVIARASYPFMLIRE
jgi:hypothetical protein